MVVRLPSRHDLELHQVLHRAHLGVADRAAEGEAGLLESLLGGAPAASAAASSAMIVHVRFILGSPSSGCCSNVPGLPPVDGPAGPASAGCRPPPRRPLPRTAQRADCAAGASLPRRSVPYTFSCTLRTPVGRLQRDGMRAGRKARARDRDLRRERAPGALVGDLGRPSSRAATASAARPMTGAVLVLRLLLRRVLHRRLGGGADACARSMMPGMSSFSAAARHQVDAGDRRHGQRPPVVQRELPGRYGGDVGCHHRERHRDQDQPVVRRRPAAELRATAGRAPCPIR